MKRVSVNLTRCISGEDALVRRILSLPKQRREEYMRNLLLRGFREEGAALAPATTAGESTEDRDVNLSVGKSEPPMTAQPTPGNDSAKDIALTALRGVVG